MDHGMSTVAATPLPGLSTATHRVRTVDLTGPAGRLEALVNEGASDALFAALVCHPHPLGGGTLHNKVVYHAMKALNASEWGLGWPVLRFNFRGTGLSEGTHDGHAETGDVLAALNWIENEYKRPVIVVGFSFGAAMSLMACCGQGREGKSTVRAIAALGLPTLADGRDYHYAFLKNCSVPKLFLSGDCDQYAPSESLRQVVAAAADPKHLVVIPFADHFFTGHLQPMQQALAGWLKEHVL
jgi:alpha/beta superfamily hydrolase